MDDPFTPIDPIECLWDGEATCPASKYCCLVMTQSDWVAYLVRRGWIIVDDSEADPF